MIGTSVILGTRRKYLKMAKATSENLLKSVKHKLTDTSSSSQRSNCALIAESANSGKCLKNFGIN